MLIRYFKFLMTIKAVLKHNTRRTIIAPFFMKIKGTIPRERFEVVWSSIDPNILPLVTVYSNVIKIEIIIVKIE